MVASFLENNLILHQVKADSWRFESARERYERFLREFPTVAGRASVNDMASYLLMTPESLSRVRSAVSNVAGKKSGYIQKNRRRMKRTFEEALEHRRSYYSIGSSSPVSDEELIRVVRQAVKHVPSAFNSQSTRIVLLLGDEHKKLWDIVKDTLKARIPAEAFCQDGG